MKPRRVLPRTGAAPGDGIYVSGAIGAAAAGFAVAAARVADAGEAAWRRAASGFLRPDPRVRLGLLLGRNAAASSCVDLSDGLADAVRQVAAASGVGAIDRRRGRPGSGGRARAGSRNTRDWTRWTRRSRRRGLRVAVHRARRRRRALEAILRSADGLPCTQDRDGHRRPRARCSGAAGEDAPLPAGFAHFR